MTSKVAARQYPAYAYAKFGTTSMFSVYCVFNYTCRMSFSGQLGTPSSESLARTIRALKRHSIARGARHSQIRREGPERKGEANTNMLYRWCGSIHEKREDRHRPV